MELKPGMFVKVKSKEELIKSRAAKYGDYEDFLDDCAGKILTLESIDSDGDWSVKEYNKPPRDWLLFPFEYDPITKIKIRLSDDMELRAKQSEAIQRKAFSHGLRWSRESSDIKSTGWPALWMDYEENRLYTGTANHDEYIELASEQYLGYEVEKENKPLRLANYDNITTSQCDVISEKPLDTRGLVPECFRDKEQDRLVVMDSIEYEVKPVIKYRCPLLCDGCQHTDTKENMIKHVKDVHGYHVSSNSPVWIHWQVS